MLWHFYFLLFSAGNKVITNILNMILFKVNQRVYFLITSLSLPQCKPVRTWVFWLISQTKGLDILFIDFLCMYMDDTYNNLRQHIFTCSRSTIEALEKVCSKSINTSEWRQWRLSGAFIVNFEHISLLFLLLLQVTLNRYIFPGINYEILRQYVAVTTFWVSKRLQKQSPKKLLFQLQLQFCYFGLICLNLSLRCHMTLIENVTLIQVFIAPC